MSAPETLPADFKFDGEGAPATLPADFFKTKNAGSTGSTGNAPDTLPADFDFNSTPPSAKKAAQPGFVSRLGQSTGIPTSKAELKASGEQTRQDLSSSPVSMLKAALGPVSTAAEMAINTGKNVWNAGKETVQEAKEAGQNIAEGGPVLKNMAKPAYGIMKTGLSAIPVIGKPIQTAGEDVATKNYAGAAGGLTGVIGQLAAPDLIHGAMPGEASVAKAGMKPMELTPDMFEESKPGAQSNADFKEATRFKPTKGAELSNLKTANAKPEPTGSVLGKIGVSPEEGNGTYLENKAIDLANAAKKTQAIADKYAASHVPDDVMKANERAQGKAADARFHADAAKHAAGVVPDVARNRDVAAADITARPSTVKTAPKPPMKAMNVKGFGEVQPETFPQEPIAPAIVPRGQTALANNQGRMGRTLQLPENVPVTEDIATAMPKIQSAIEDTTGRGFSKSGSSPPAGYPKMTAGETAIPPAAEPSPARIRPADVETQLNRGMGNEPMKPGVAMRNQGKAPVIELPVKPPTSQDIHIHGERMEDAVTKHAGKYGLDTNDLRKQIHNVTNAELGELASRAGVDMANKTVGRAKNVPNQVSRPELFNQLLDRKATPQTILDLKNNPKWTMDEKGSPITEQGVPPVSGSRGVVPYESALKGRSTASPYIAAREVGEGAESVVGRGNTESRIANLSSRGAFGEASQKPEPYNPTNETVNSQPRIPTRAVPIDEMAASRREAFRRAEEERSENAQKERYARLATPKTEAELRAEMPKGWRSKYSTEDEAYKAWTDAHEELAKAVGVRKRADRALAKSETSVGTMERYTNPKGDFYKNVLNRLEGKMAPEAAQDAAQETMAAFQQSVNDGWELPKRVTDEGRVTAYLKKIADHKIADWAAGISDETKSGVAKGVVEGNPRMSSVKGSSASDKGPDAMDEPEEDKTKQQSPFGFGQTNAGTTDVETAASRDDLKQVFDAHPEVSRADREMLLGVAAKSVEKAEAARTKAYDKKLANSTATTAEGKETEARKAGADAAQQFHDNARNSKDALFGFNDDEMTEAGRGMHMTGPKFRKWLTDKVETLRKPVTATEAPTYKYPGAAGSATWNSARRISGSALEGSVPHVGGLGKIESTEPAPTIAKPSESYGNAPGFSTSQPKVEAPIGLAHTPGRIGGLDLAVVGPRTPHVEVWSSAKTLTKPLAEGAPDIGAGNTLPLTEPLPVGKPASAEAPRITSRAPVINPADTSWNRERLGDLRSKELIDNRARQQAKARIMEKLRNARDNAKTPQAKHAAEVKLGNAENALGLDTLPGEEIQGLRRVKNSSGLGRAK